MALDPGPLVALVAGGAMGALMRWAGPRARAWRRRLDARPALRRAVVAATSAAALAGIGAVTAHPAWLDDIVAWAEQGSGPAVEACPAAEGADRPAMALARLLAACPPPTLLTVPLPAATPILAWLAGCLVLLLAGAASISAVRRRRWRLALAAAVVAALPAGLAAWQLRTMTTPTPPSTQPRHLATRGQILAGPVTHVRDGDTIVVGRTPIRFADIDCAENGTPEGDRATQALRRLAAGQQVQCRMVGRRSYDREIGICTLADGRNLGLALVTLGLCLRR